MKGSFVSLNGWGYSIFSPLSTALVLFLVLWVVRLRNAKAAYQVGWASIFGVAAFLFVAKELYGISFLLSKAGEVQYWGYLLGGALVSLTPFALMLITLLAFKETHLHLRVGAAILLISVLMFLFPPFFFAGSVVGCVILGVNACL